MPPRRLFIHSAERPVHSAWLHLDANPEQSLALDVGMSVQEQADAVRSGSRTESSLLFAHSIRAVPAVLAARSAHVSGLVLVEPALYDLARGVPSIERHIAIVSEARALASTGDLRGCWAMLRPVMFGGPFDEDLWATEAATAERWSTTPVPWGHGIRERMVAGIPILVVTGGWNDEYEAIAEILSSRGAEHVILPGAGHRPQDLPGLGPVVEEFESRLRR
ncbi:MULTISPECIES: hypothetical protein [unclassified Microbacterium]|uniref:hypothetical protein n=1 Tax=unclassified Microbacterium TaxID=2609290 RepID=UPI0034339EBD